MTSTDTGSLWLRRFHPILGATRLVCFPHAGGAATSFYSLSKALAPAIETLAVQYPGRQDRLGEAPLTSIPALADALTDELTGWTDRPLALFGHSMGALVAFEVANRLASRAIGLLTLYVSGHKPPQLLDNESVRGLSDEQVAAKLKKLSGTDTGLLDDPAMLRMILPAVRADYEALGAYAYWPSPRLACPIIALTGDRDPLVSPEQQLGWRELTSTQFDLHVFPGGHFFLNEHETGVCDVIDKHLVS